MRLVPRILGLRRSDTVIGLPRDALLFAITHWCAMRLNLGKYEFRDAVCRCWSWARFNGVDNEFFATPKGEEPPPKGEHRSERCHQGEQVCALRWHVHSPGTSNSLFLSLTGRTAAADVLVLEEVGVTALSPHIPLMSLHSLLDRGIEVDGQFVHLCITGNLKLARESSEILLV